MRFILFTLLLPFICKANDPSRKPATLYFLENRGQVTDQYRLPRKDINFSVSTTGMTAFIGRGKIYYQFYKPAAPDADGFTEVTSYRLDVSLVGANTNAGIITEEKQDYYEYYHTDIVEDIVHAYKKLTYRNVYPGIDWVISARGNEMKYEFMVHPGADPSAIRIRYNGASSLGINNDGSFTAITPLGNITEQTPYCFSEDGKKVNSSFKLEGNILSFVVAPYEGTLTIDPTLEWATFYGDIFSETGYATITDKYGDVYMAGQCAALNIIATTGAYQETFGGYNDAFLAKFNKAGIRQWATYFGGAEEDLGVALATDSHARIYMTGKTRSMNGIASPGAHQQTYGGGTTGYGDAFLVKFDSTGTFQWSTYYGGAEGDIGVSVALDNLENIYISGHTKSDTGIATIGAHKEVLSGGTDVFIVKFNSAGVRQWGTYYGGGGDENGCVATDKYGNLYMAGTNGASITGIATPGSHQPTFGFGYDGMLVKFNSDGVRQWGTYYGGSGEDGISAITTDTSGLIYIAGYTTSFNNIATPGTHQPVKSLLNDGFVSCFNGEGVRQWGTYYGGTGAEEINSITTDKAGHIYISGATTSDAGIAVNNAYLDIYQDGRDGFWSVFNSAGERTYGTYFGGEMMDVVNSIAVDDSANVYICGYTSSTDIATVNGHQPLYPSGANRTAFLARFHANDLMSVDDFIASDNTHTFSLYPNPNDGKFVLSGYIRASRNEVNIQVTDITGRIVFSDNFESTDGMLRKSLNLQHLPSQMYMLRITAGKEVENIPFIKR